ncbi:MAG TPA: M64 family metallopeptidase [Vicinamibacterales bacterium]
MRELLLPALIIMVTGVASAEPVVPIRINGPDANRLGMIIMGDGYTQNELLKFSTDVDLLVRGIFEQSPYSEYASYFNVYRVDVTSNESGADHPESGTTRDTALGSTYNCGGIVRTVCIDTAAVNAVLSRSVPVDVRDLVVVLVNDTAYGGSGGSVLVASVDRDSVELLLHESGHTLGRLADEYETTPPPCSNTVDPPEVNAALGIGRDTIKWSRWVDASTPLPTTTTQTGVPGAYLGARYCADGLYRPTVNSKMRSLARPFEQINSEQLVRRVYNFVSPLDSVSPAETSLTPPLDASVDFKVNTPQPATHSLRILWSIDGSPAGEGNSMRLNTAGLAAGNHVVEAQVSDQTPLVRNDPTGLLTARRTWNVIISAPGSDDIRRALEDLLRRWRNR